MPNLDSLLSFPTASSSASQRTPIPPRSSHILVTDTIDAPALFVLTHFLRASHAVNKSHRLHTKGNVKSHTRVIWLGCSSDGCVHLKNVARRSGVHLDQEVRDGAFAFIDAHAENLIPLREQDLANAVQGMRIREDTSEAEECLLQLYSKVAEQLHHVSSDNDDEVWTSRALIVVDDLTALAWASNPNDSFGQPLDLSRLLTDWITAVTSLAAKVSRQL